MDLPELRDSLVAVPGVASVDMRWPDPDGPVRVRVSFEPGADRDAVTTRVLELLRSSRAVDASTIDVATQVSSRPDGARPVFRGLNVSNGDLEAAVEVVLEVRGRRVTGRAEGLSVPASEIRTAAAATLHALRGVLPSSVRLELDWLDLGRAGGGEPTALVQTAIVCLAAGGRPQRLYGTAEVRNDARIAAARATLDALNRRLEQLAAAA